jgi:hypothetical protein
MKITQYEPQLHRKEERARVKAGDVEQCLKSSLWSRYTTVVDFGGKTLRIALEEMG